ncbi:MAG TPA: membrane protein insertase YidC [Verrucomicrobiae bacterium]|nr:membrane protein insertase YidC [Verrucomicrobiae bacterium]
MDRTGIIVISICVVLLGVWFFGQREQAKRYAEAQRQFMLTNQPPAVEIPATNAITAPAKENSATTVPAVLETNAPESLVVISNADARYTFTSLGGGLKKIELLKYPEVISVRWKKNTNSSDVNASLNTHAPVPALSVVSDGFLGNGSFTLTRTGDGVRAEKILQNGLRVVKDFHVGSNYLFNASVRFENTSGKPLALAPQEIVVGTATPMDVDDTSFSFYGGAMWFDGQNSELCPVSYFNTNSTAFFVFHRTVKNEYTGGTNNVQWAAAYNQYFALLAMPKEPAREVIARPVYLPPLADGAPAPMGVQTALIFPATTLSANSNVERQITFYAGPKEYRTLVKIADKFRNHADDVMNFGRGYVSFWGIGTFFAKLLLSAMNALHDLTTLGYGWVIVVLTILLRAVFWPLTAKSMRSMKKMQALAPELKAIQEKHKDDVQKLFQKRNELLKKNNVSQMSGCLPMLIQMPVFLGFFTMIRSAIELRGAHFLWVADLSKPDTLFVIPGLTFLPFSTPAGWPLNLLPLLMVGVMVWQAHLQPPSPGMDPAQQRMMRFMPLILLLFLYNYSAGMALYMTVSTSASVVQSWLVKRNNTAAPAPALTPSPKQRK